MKISCKESLSNWVDITQEEVCSAKKVSSQELEIVNKVENSSCSTRSTNVTSSTPTRNVKKEVTSGSKANLFITSKQKIFQKVLESLIRQE